MPAVKQFLDPHVDSVSVGNRTNPSTQSNVAASQSKDECHARINAKFDRQHEELWLVSRKTSSG